MDTKTAYSLTNITNNVCDLDIPFPSGNHSRLLNRFSFRCDLAIIKEKAYHFRSIHDKASRPNSAGLSIERASSTPYAESSPLPFRHPHHKEMQCPNQSG